MESDKSGVWIKNGPGSGFAYQDKSTHFVCFLGKEEEEEEYRGQVNFVGNPASHKSGCPE